MPKDFIENVWMLNLISNSLRKIFEMFNKDEKKVWDFWIEILENNKEISVQINKNFLNHDSLLNYLNEKELLLFFNLNENNNYDIYLLLYLMISNNLDIFKLIINTYEEPEKILNSNFPFYITLLSIAIIFNKIEFIKEILKQYDNIQGKNDKEFAKTNIIASLVVSLILYRPEISKFLTDYINILKIENACSNPINKKKYQEKRKRLCSTNNDVNIENIKDVITQTDLGTITDNSSSGSNGANSGNQPPKSGNNNSNVSVGERAGTSGTQGQNFNQKQQNNQYDVPADGSCLFWSVTMGYLLPVRNNIEEFRTRFIQLFGRLQVSYLSYVQALLQQFDVTNHTLSQAWYQDATANRLVRVVLRNRVVDYIEANLDTNENDSSRLTFRNLVQENNEIADNYLESMRHPSTWGGLPEIIAMSNILNANISVNNDNPYQPINQNSSNTINLSYVELKEGSGVKNHYNFTLTEEETTTSAQSVQNYYNFSKNTTPKPDGEAGAETSGQGQSSISQQQTESSKVYVGEKPRTSETQKQNSNANNFKKAIIKYNELSKETKQQRINEINQHYQNLSENDKKDFENKLKAIGSAAIGGGIGAVGTTITLSGTSSTMTTAATTSSLTAAESIKMTPLLSEGLTAAETLSVVEETAVVATEGAVIGAEAGTAAALAPETLGLSLVIGGIVIGGTAFLWWLNSDHTTATKHESHNQYNEIEKYYKFLKHDQLKLGINSNTWDKIKKIYQENKNNFEIFKNKIKSEITNFQKEDHSGWGGTISNDDINILIKIMFNHFEEIDNHFTNNSNHGWKIVTNTTGSYFQIDSE